MTTIAAYIDHDDRIAIATDSAFTGRVVLRAAIGEKLKHYGELVVGFSGSTHACNFRSATVYPATSDGVFDFANDLRKFMRDAGHGAVENRASLMPGNAIVVGPNLPPHLVEIDGGVVALDRYVAIGSGHDIAVGALWMANENKMSAKNAVRSALLAASEHDPYTAGAIDLWSWEPPDGGSL